jgi:hypothetical protein
VNALELPSIGWQLFVLNSSQSDSTAFLSSLDTYVTRLLTEPLIHRSAWKINSEKFAVAIFGPRNGCGDLLWPVLGTMVPTPANVATNETRKCSERLRLAT